MFTQLNQYHVILEVKPEFQQHPGRRCASIYVRSRRRQAGAAQRVQRSVERDARRRLPSITRGSSRSVTFSFNLAPGVVAGRGGARDRARPSRNSGCRPSIQAGFQGTAQAFQASLANEPLLILAALVTVYIVLGVLYESYIHPITILSTLPSAGVGALLALLLCQHRAERHRAHRHHPADRHRQEERHHDDRLRPGGRAQGRQDAARRDLPGLPAAFPADHDDHHGGAAGGLPLALGTDHYPHRFSKRLATRQPSTSNVKSRRPRHKVRTPGIPSL